LAILAMYGSPNVGEVWLFSNANFSGQMWRFNTDVPNFSYFGANDRVSSIRVGPGTQAYLFQHANFMGQAICVAGDYPHLAWMNDRASSMRIFAQGITMNFIPPTQLIMAPPVANIGMPPPGWAGISFNVGVAPGMMPGMMPGMVQPGMVQPGMVQPGMMQPGMVQPGMMQPGMMQPGMMQPGMVQPGMVQPGMVQPGMMPGMVQPGVMPGVVPGAAIVMNTPIQPAMVLTSPYQGVGPQPGEVWVFRGRDFTGECYHLRGEVPDLRMIGINNDISSVMVGPQTEALLYKDQYFRGDSLPVLTHLPHLGHHFNDKVSSIRCVYPMGSYAYPPGTLPAVTTTPIAVGY